MTAKMDAVLRQAIIRDMQRQAEAKSTAWTRDCWMCGAAGFCRHRCDASYAAEWAAGKSRDGAQAMKRTEARMTPFRCTHVYTWALGNVRCHVCGEPTEAAHRLVREMESGTEVELRCEAHCPKHKPAEPLPNRAIEATAGKQGGLFS